MEKTRVFISLNLPPSIKTEVASLLRAAHPSYPDFIRFLDQDMWHITISFLAYQTLEDIARIADATKEAVSQFSAPRIAFDTITYGPRDRHGDTKRPRMIWLNCDHETSRALSEFKKVLENNLKDHGIHFRDDYKQFHGHVTLARFDDASINDLPPLGLKCSHTFTAERANVMESRLYRTGARYESLSSFDFVK